MTFFRLDEITLGKLWLAVNIDRRCLTDIHPQNATGKMPAADIMPFYHALGKIPHKRHTIFKNGKDRFFYEQLFGTVGFDGMSTLLYHTHRPTQVKEIIRSTDVTPKVAVKACVACGSPALR